MWVYDLTNNPKNAVQRFAARHDWYVRDHDDGVIVREIWLDNQGQLQAQYKFFDSLGALRVWAGY